MTEADEVAQNILENTQQRPRNMQEAREIAKRLMPGESFQVIDNVAESLLREDGE